MNQGKVLLEYLDKMKNIEENVLQYLEDDPINDNILQELINIMVDQNFLNDKHEFKSILNLISKISNNHHQYKDFFIKIDNILKKIQNNIKNVFSNSEIFEIFKFDKRLLLTLFENNILIPDKSISDIITNDSYEFKSRFYPQYFYPEFKDFIDPCYKEMFVKDQNEFNTKRKIGQNGSNIGKLIQEDYIDEFIKYITQNLIQSSSIIPPSIYETNLFLLENEQTVIQYATFYGSIQIFNYLMLDNPNFDSSLWFHVVHSQNEEIISRFNDDVKHPYDSIETTIKESIKCHHNEITNYFILNSQNIDLISLLPQVIESYSFVELANIFTNESFDIYDWKEIDKKTSKTNSSILYDFCQYFKIVDFLINNTYINMNLMVKSDVFQTALIHAIKQSNFDMVKLLVSNADTNVNCISFKSNYAKTALNIAVENNNIQIAELLLSNPNIDVNLLNEFTGEKWSKTYKNALIISIENNNLEMTKLLLRNPKININSKLKSNEITITPLNLATNYNKIEMVKLLLSNGNIDVNLESNSLDTNNSYHNVTALCIAVKNNNIEIIKLLLSHHKIEVNKQPSYYCETALNMAIKNENLEIINLLLSSQSIKVNSKSWSKDETSTALNLAVSKNNIEIIKLLLNNPNIDVNLYSTIGNIYETAIGIAVKNNNIEIIKLLLSHPKIEANKEPIGGYMGDTPLNTAIINGNIEIVKLLLSHPSTNVNSKSIFNIKKITAINAAIKSNNIEIVKILLSCPNIDVNYQHDYKYFLDTPLNISVKNDNFEITKILLSNPIIDVNNNKSYKKYRNQSPLYIASKNNNIGIVKLLLEDKYKIII